MPRRLRLLLVDDHEIVRNGLRAMLEVTNDFVVCGEAGSAAEAVRLTAHRSPDLVVLDVRLPDASGIEACRQILRLSPAVRVVMLSAFADPADVAQAREAGAAGYLVKRLRGEDLTEAIKRVAEGEQVYPPRAGGRPDVIETLTERELSILELIAQGKTNREIAEQLFLAEKTVKNYVSNLLTKMGLAHRAGAAARLASHRYRLPPEEWVETGTVGRVGAGRN
jgi:two-component system response regulator DevR